MFVKGMQWRRQTDAQEAKHTIGDFLLDAVKASRMPLRANGTENDRNRHYGWNDLYSWMFVLVGLVRSDADLDPAASGDDPCAG